MSKDFMSVLNKFLNILIFFMRMSCIRLNVNYAALDKITLALEL